MADATLCFALYWAGSNKQIACKHCFTAVKHAWQNGLRLQDQVAELVNVEPHNIKLLLGSPAGPQLTPVLFPPSLVRSESNIEGLPAHKEMVAAWSSLTPDQVSNVFVTQHSCVALTVDALARLFRIGKCDACAYIGLPSSLHCNPIVALAALDGIELFPVILPDELSKNRQFALAAMRQVRTPYCILSCFDYTMRNNEDVVLAAVARNHHELFYASERLRKSKTFVLKAVSVNGLCIKTNKDNDHELFVDKEVALAAVTQNAAAFPFLCSTLKADKDVQQACNNS